MALLQSGGITPGNIAIWVTTGVLADGGPLRSATNVLASLGSANFNVTTDQAIQLPNTITAFQISGILVCNASQSLTTAVGGFYPTTAKGGTAIVSSAQAYSSLTTAANLLSCTLAAGGNTTRYSSLNVDNVDGYLTIYLSLSTPQGVECTGDIFLLGTNLTLTG